MEPWRARDAILEALRLKMEPWRVCILVVADSHHFNEKQVPETHQCEKSDPDPHESQKMNRDPHWRDVDPQPCPWICLLNLFCGVFRWNSSHDEQRVMSGKKGPVKPVFFSPGQSVVEVDTCSSASALGRPSPPPHPPLLPLPLPLSSPLPPPDVFPGTLKPTLRKMIDGTNTMRFPRFEFQIFRQFLTSRDGNPQRIKNP